MIRTIADFDRLWQTEMEATQKIFKHLTTRSLTQEVHLQLVPGDSFVLPVFAV